MKTCKMNLNFRVFLSVFALPMVAVLMAGALSAQNPLKPDTLFVDSSNAQAGTRGHPVGFVDTTPIFSFIVRHGDAAGVADKFKIQVATDKGFSNKVWNPGFTNMTNACDPARNTCL